MIRLKHRVVNQVHVHCTLVNKKKIIITPSINIATIMIAILRLGCLDEAISDLERLEEAGLCPPSRLHLLLNKLVTTLK